MRVTGMYRKNLHSELAQIWAPANVDQLKSTVVRESKNPKTCSFPECIK